MAFREKSAWIMTVALLLGGVFYFSVVVRTSLAMGGVAPPVAPLIALYTGLLVVLATVGHIAVAMLSPREARQPLDERERTIATRASHRSGHLLGAGALLSLGLYWVFQDGDLLFYGVFRSLMLSQLLEYVLQIFFYRSAVT